ncbi:MAG: hypothetical protein JWO43_119 [Candidatus Adlerbacteria bacterium]|nr:hypothetical protein [Candidatus Adlerbacteria bacterium]
MTPFEEFSKEVDALTAAHKRSRLSRFVMWVEYRRRRWSNDPMQFRMVETEGKPVGDSMDVYHMSLHDMMHHEVCGQLTAEVLLKGRRINAFSRGAYKQMEDLVGRITIQPRWV